MHNTDHRHPIRYASAICLAVLVSVCCVSGRQEGTGIEAHEDGASRTVYVASNGFHTGLIIELDDETRPMLVFSKYFPLYRYVDIGWGDEVFYQNPQFSIGNAARAILIPTSSVLRVEAFNADPRDVAAWSSRATRIPLKGKEFERICEYIDASFTKGPDGSLIVDSMHGGGSVIFFKSPYKYHLFRTCNTWIAGAFRCAGLDISPTCVITASGLFRRLNKIGEPLK